MPAPTQSMTRAVEVILNAVRDLATPPATILVCGGARVGAALSQQLQHTLTYVSPFVLVHDWPLGLEFDLVVVAPVALADLPAREHAQALLALQRRCRRVLVFSLGTAADLDRWVRAAHLHLHWAGPVLSANGAVARFAEWE